jgi:pyridoxine 5-phosphate synthase
VVELSVNVNKVATVRNSRGGVSPSVLEAAHACVVAGARSITVHPRADERHIRRSDVLEIAALLRERFPRVELNIEGDPRSEWLELCAAVEPAQATLVPVRPGEITSEAGWPSGTDLRQEIRALKRGATRVGVFIEPSENAVQWAAAMGADRVELYTGPFAEAFGKSEAEGRSAFATHVRAADRAHALGLGINAGHDLDLANLRLYCELPFLDEVSIGHALIGRALFVGLDRAVREYLDVLAGR